MNTVADVYPASECGPRTRGYCAQSKWPKRARLTPGALDQGGGASHLGPLVLVGGFIGKSVVFDLMLSGARMLASPH
jgi:hypothetical protein